MILTPIPAESIPAVLARYAACLDPTNRAAMVFARIAASLDQAAEPAETRWHAEALALAQQFGMQPVLAPPQTGFSWDGRQVRALSEAAVLVHEVAHYQLASPERRRLPDFGLGAGPETGLTEIADQARRVDDQTREIEEQMASLLGILWEIEIGQPGILAFQEQNWLEGAGRPSAARFLAQTLDRLFEAGVIGEDGRPVFALRLTRDPD